MEVSVAKHKVLFGSFYKHIKCLNHHIMTQINKELIGKLSLSTLQYSRVPVTGFLNREAMRRRFLSLWSKHL